MLLVVVSSNAAMAKEGWEKELSPCSLRAVIRGVLVNDILFT